MTDTLYDRVSELGARVHGTGHQREIWVPDGDFTVEGRCCGRPHLHRAYTVNRRGENNCGVADVNTTYWYVLCCNCGAEVAATEAYLEKMRALSRWRRVLGLWGHRVTLEPAGSSTTEDAASETGAR